MVFSDRAISYEPINHVNPSLCEGQYISNGPTLVYHINYRPNSTNWRYILNFDDYFNLPSDFITHMKLNKFQKKNEWTIAWHFQDLNN